MSENGLRDTLPARRRSELVRLARVHGQVTIAGLMEMFDVSADTVRRDLDLLAERGLLARTHGGAVASDDLVTRDAPFAERLTTRKAAKDRIARAAVTLVNDGETLIINGGSTTRAFAAELGVRRNLTVVTNNLEVPLVLGGETVRDIYVLGGQYRAEAQVTIGELGFGTVTGISADMAVIGVGGLSAAGGLSTTILAEAGMIAAMIAAARRTIVLADVSKCGHNSFAQIAPLARVDTLVTDAAPAADLNRALEEAGVEVIIA